MNHQSEKFVCISQCMCFLEGVSTSLVISILYTHTNTRAAAAAPPTYTRPTCCTPFNRSIADYPSLTAGR